MDPQVRIPDGWCQISPGTKLQKGDRFLWYRGSKEIADWRIVADWEFGVPVSAGGANIIRKQENMSEAHVVRHSTIMNEVEKENSMIPRQNLIALLALVSNQKSDAEDVLPGTSGDGVFAQALRDAEKERREEAVKALTGIAKEIQDTLGREKANLRASIKSVRETERGYLTRLNELDAAAALLSGETPNPFPLMSRLGLVHRGDLALSTAEFEALVAVPKA